MGSASFAQQRQRRPRSLFLCRGRCCCRCAWRRLEWLRLHRRAGGRARPQPGCQARCGAGLLGRRRPGSVASDCGRPALPSTVCSVRQTLARDSCAQARVSRVRLLCCVTGHDDGLLSLAGICCNDACRPSECNVPVRMHTAHELCNQPCLHVVGMPPPVTALRRCNPAVRAVELTGSLLTTCQVLQPVTFQHSHGAGDKPSHRSGAKPM